MHFPGLHIAFFFLGTFNACEGKVNYQIFINDDHAGYLQLQAQPWLIS